MPNYKVVGHSLPRVDAAEKAMGRAVYATEVKLPGMLAGGILRSPYPHARIVRIDTSRAARIPGVKAVLTLEDVPQHRIGLVLQDHYIFAKDRVRYIGEEVAAVAATDEDTMQDAMEAIEVEYEELPPVFDPEEARNEAAPLLHEELDHYEFGLWGQQYGRPMRPGTNICGFFTLRKGDPELGFGQADYVFQDTFRTHSVYHGYLEPHACVASYDPASGRVTIWTSTQRPFLVRSYVSQAFGLPVSQVRVLATLVGGGFGGKGRPGHEAFAVALSLKTGQPVRLVMTREEDFALYRAPECVIKLKIGAKRDGTLPSLAMDITWDTGAYAEALNYGRGPLEALPGPYRIPNVSIDSYTVCTNRMPSSAFRGRLMPQPTFAIECAMDMIAEKLGLDALEFRMKNLVDEGSVNASGHVLRSVGAKQCLQEAAKAIGWGRKVGPNRGIGLVCYHKYPPPPYPSSAVVQLNEDGTVLLQCGAPELGQGSQTALAQIAAEELGVRLEDVRMPLCDTDHTPFDAGALGDRLTTSAGNAIRIAAADAREQALAIAAHMLKVNQADLTMQDGRIIVRDAPEIWTTLPRVCAAAHTRFGGQIIGKGTYMGAMSRTGDGPRTGDVSPVWKYGAQAAEVEVDPETGAVKVIKLVSAQDVGQAINPLSLQGQMDGAALMGLGLALWEEVLFDGGQVANPNLMDYRLPMSLDSVKGENIIVECPSPDGPFGAKGVGEEGTVGVAPAVANAIYNAVGVRLRGLPMSPQKVRAALAAKTT